MSDRTGPRYSVIPANAVYDTTLKPSALRVLCALGAHADKQGWCFPQQGELAKRLSLDRARVSHAITALVERGYVAAELRIEKGKGMRGLWYRVILDTPGARPPDHLDTMDSGGVRKSAHRDDAEQNGETGPVCANEHTGAGVRKSARPVCAKAHTAYIAERPNRTMFPLNPPQAGEARVRKSKSKRGGRKAVEPREFVEAWGIWTKAGSNRSAALKAWRAHRASGKRKLAAVRAYLASKQAQAENGRFVPYMQRWLRDSLGSFVEVADKAASARAKLERERDAASKRPEPVFCRDCRVYYRPGEERCHCAERPAQPAAAL